MLAGAPGCCSLCWGAAAARGALFLPLGHSKVTKLPLPGVAVDACAANALCKPSFAFLLSFFFWFYLTDLLKKQRGNTNDMFNTDQLTALQHPKEHKHHIIRSPRRRLRTKARRTAHGGAMLVVHGAELSSQLCPCQSRFPRLLPSVRRAFLG